MTVASRESFAAIDVSLVLNLHREGKYLVRTLRSLSEAAVYARSFGLKVEIVIVLDRSDSVTRDILFKFDLGGFDRYSVHAVDRGSLGLSRNVAIQQTSGKWIALCDGDDLISFNYIHNAYLEAERSGEMSLYMPQWYMGFGEMSHFAEFTALDVVTPLAFCDMHPYGSRTFGHSALYKTIPFAHLPLSDGYAFEDWHHNAEVVAAGYDVRIIDGAIVFYRYRTASLLQDANRISTRQIPPSKLFEPAIFRDRCAHAVRRFRANDDPRKAVVSNALAIFTKESTMAVVAAANKIDPSIELGVLKHSPEYLVKITSNIHIGLAYFDACGALDGRQFTDVVLVPFFGKGGGERYFINLIHSLHRRGKSILVIMGEPHPTNEWLSRLPDDVRIVDVGGARGTCEAAGIDLIALKIIQSCGKDAVLHVRDSAFGQSFVTRYGRALKNKRIFYMFCEVLVQQDGLPVVVSWPFKFVSERLDWLDRIVADNHTILALFQNRLGLARSEKWHYLPTLCLPFVSLEEARRRSLADASRVLWASRIDWQKRPGLIPLIAELLAVAKPGLTIDVFGDGQCDGIDADLLAKIPNIEVRGSYEDFKDLIKNDYLCLVYTSNFDGIPTVILEAAGSGLPVIAPDVGGVHEHIHDNVTGVLIPPIADDHQMAAAYVDALVRLADDPNLRCELVGNSYMKLLEKHSVAAYEKALTSIL